MLNGGENQEKWCLNLEILVSESMSHDGTFLTVFGQNQNIQEATVLPKLGYSLSFWHTAYFPL